MVVSGLPAAGKSSLARRLGRDLGIVALSRDRLKSNQLAGFLPPEERWRIGAANRQVLQSALAAVLDVGQPVIADGNFNWSYDREGLREFVADRGVDTFEICLWADPAVLRRRFADRADPPFEGDVAALFEEAVARSREPVTTGPRIEFDTTDFDALERAYESLREDVRWFADRFPAKRVGAGAIIRDDRGRVLLVHQAYGQREWTIPGGLVEQFESPLAGCQREVKEEVGLDVEVGRLLTVECSPADFVLFYFDGGTLTDAQGRGLTLPPDELDGFEFVAPDRLADFLVGDRLARVIRAVGA